jgi:lipid-A-disaccharide synthase-like uncharacterized protein|tara:strand:- start:34 stop:654 length:621 start_codon:yes stop_codon:yes gene_type:complete
MNNIILYLIGFSAQLLFSSRLIIQWFYSEKENKIITPSVFWILSLLGSFLLFIYGYLRDDFAIMLGQSLTYFIYIRNLQLQGEWSKLNFFIRFLFLTFPVYIIFYYYNNNVIDLDILIRETNIPSWLFSLGITSQLIFTFRFIFQWIYSENKKESSLPLGFWLLSISGSILILIYAIFRLDPVLFIGHIIGTIIYARNIYIYFKFN